MVREGEQLRLETIRPEQHFTEPPPRYTEATLVKELEEKGIGRPSTYAAIISTIVEREYVNKDQGRFTPTMLGEKVSDLLVKAFEDIFDVGFTARLEDELDEIEEGKLPWRTAVEEFWDRFAVDLDNASDEMESYKAGIPTGQKCEKCGEGELLERISRHGFFLGCSRYPDCDFIRDLAEPGTVDTEGETARPSTATTAARKWPSSAGASARSWRARAIPNCKTTRRLVAGTLKALQPDVDARRKMPDLRRQLAAAAGPLRRIHRLQELSEVQVHAADHAGNQMPEVQRGRIRPARHREGPRQGRIFYGCSRYPDCDFTTPHEPIAEPCPKCGAPFIVEKRTKQGNFRSCIRENCDWEMAVPEPPPVATSAPAPDFVHPQNPPTPEPVGAAPSKS